MAYSKQTWTNGSGGAISAARLGVIESGIEATAIVADAAVTKTPASGSPQTITAGAATDIGLIIKGATSQSASLAEWRNAAGTALATVTSAGNVVTPQVQASYVSSNSGNGPYFTLDGTQVLLRGLVTSNPLIKFRGMASQTGALSLWEDSASSTLASVSSAGLGTFAGVTLSGNTALTIGSSGEVKSNYYSETTTGSTGITLGTTRNVSLCRFGADFGSGEQVVAIGNASVVPSATPTGGGILYSDAGALKWRGTSGTITTIAAA